MNGLIRTLISLLLLSFISSCTKTNSDLTDISFSYCSYSDNSNQYTIKTIEKIPFHISEKVNIHFFKGTIWIALKITNHSPSRKTLIIHNNDRINRNYKFYKLDSTINQLHSLNTIKDIQYNDDRFFNFSKPNFRIVLEPHEQGTYYIQTSNNGKVVRATPYITSLQEFIRIIYWDTIENIFFYGMMFIIFCITIFYWIILKKKLYLFYTLYILFTCFLYIGFDGYLYGHDLPIIIVEHLIFVFYKCSIFFLIIFSAHFLGIKKTYPQFYLYLKCYTVIVITGLLIYQLLFCSTQIGKIHIVEYGFGVGWLLLLLSMIIKAAQKQKQETIQYVLAMSFALFFVSIGILNICIVSDVTGNTFFKIGTTFEFIIFTYSTAHILGKKSNKIKQYIRHQSILENSNIKLQSKLYQVNNTKIKKNDFLNIFKLLESNLTNEGEWASFKQKFQELNPHFLSNLYEKHPELSKNEIRLLTLVKIGFTQKEISNMLFITEGSVKKAKQRVRKKIAISTNVTLSSYLSIF
ncbi:7TM diverse intracellular signaling domain-containing protein [Aquimarina hainanensis]|uniref:7TM diverse intracellular signaling domain-containing protein n=1 Tax=Aquimarina hainanensis TaxID=1578017 RepID=A0ABW5N7W6_9FLAO